MRFYAQRRFFMYLTPSIWAFLGTDHVVRAFRHPSFEHNAMAIVSVLLVALYIAGYWFTYWELTPEGLVERSIKGKRLIPYSIIENVSTYSLKNGKKIDWIQIDAPFGQKVIARPVEYAQFAEGLEKMVDPAVMHI